MEISSSTIWDLKFSDGWTCSKSVGVSEGLRCVTGRQQGETTFSFPSV